MHVAKSDLQLLPSGGAGGFAANVVIGLIAINAINIASVFFEIILSPSKVMFAYRHNLVGARLLIVMI